jgi:hypothetical protein
MIDPRGMAMVADSAKFAEGDVVRARRPSNVSGKVPEGDDYVPWNNYYRNFYTTEIEVR